MAPVTPLGAKPHPAGGGWGCGVWIRPAGEPQRRGGCASSPTPGSVQAAVISPGFCYNKRCIFMVSYNKLRCQTPLEPPCRRGAVGPGCAWGQTRHGVGVPRDWAPWGWVGCGVTGLWDWAGHGAMRPGCPWDRGAVGPGCPLGCGQQAPTLPSPGSADVSGPTRALPGHVVTAPLLDRPSPHWAQSKLLQHYWGVPRVASPARGAAGC